VLADKSGAHRGHPDGAPPLLQDANTARGLRLGILTDTDEAARHRRLEIPRLAVLDRAHLPGHNLPLVTDRYLWLLNFDDHHCETANTGAHLHRNNERTHRTLTRACTAGGLLSYRMYQLSEWSRYTLRYTCGHAKSPKSGSVKSSDACTNRLHVIVQRNAAAGSQQKY
jgi:hypothetical protein